ncbi:MAG: Ig domain-containing protein, partial [Alistipes sp.]|nr:Ig domain-containing protein [Alistipes sp.]
MKKYLLSAFAIVALLFAACGGDDGVSTTVPVSGIKLDKSSLSLEIGQKATLTATIAPSDATNKSITWSSANQNIATVNNGVVSGVAAGETTITAKANDGGYTATVSVKVVPNAVKVSQIKLVGVPTEAKEGRIITISAVITPTDATDMTVTFTSSNPDVVKVEFTKSESNYSLATLTAVSPGKAKITATANDG